ncbi:MAG: hypothetical protein N4A49_04190 [Marinifilaceae bacterium]|jgi:hypothetical protein|nr:hypothetical protein [Marinifilaceae bacterium]
MKKLLYSLIVLFVLSLGLSSCVVDKKCPAYTYAKVKLEKNSEQNV